MNSEKEVEGSLRELRCELLLAYEEYCQLLRAIREHYVTHVTAAVGLEG